MNMYLLLGVCFSNSVTTLLIALQFITITRKYKMLKGRHLVLQIQQEDLLRTMREMK